jgi:hypothetical protein
MMNTRKEEVISEKFAHKNAIEVIKHKKGIPFGFSHKTTKDSLKLQHCASMHRSIFQRLKPW